MAGIPEDVRVKVSGDAADWFVQSYYPTLSNPKLRNTLAEYYVKTTGSPSLEPDISLNGNIVVDAEQFQHIYENEVKRAKHEVGSYDAQVINTNYNVGVEDDSKLGPASDGSKMSIVVTVSGSVEYYPENTEAGDKRVFQDVVVLVPNWKSQEPRAPKGTKKWLIQSQVFRIVV